jgi:hypothetical protein
MISREEYLAFWNIPPEEAEAAWAAKVALDTGPRAQVPMAFVQKDICYDSPVDGRPITNKHARIEDLARTNCVEYDPGMKTDYQRRVAENDKHLDKQVDETVDRAIATLPARKRENLAAEMERGITVEPTRLTSQASIVTAIRG